MPVCEKCHAAPCLCAAYPLMRMSIRELEAHIAMAQSILKGKRMADGAAVSNQSDHPPHGEGGPGSNTYCSFRD